MTPEGKVKHAIKKMLKEEFPQVWTFWPVSNGMGAHGIPDMVMCAGGKFIGVEVKADGKKVTLLQADQLQKIEASGGTVLVVRGVSEVAILRTLLNCMNLPRPPAALSDYPIQRISQDAYDKITDKDPNKIYLITDPAP